MNLVARMAAAQRQQQQQQQQGRRAPIGQRRHLLSGGGGGGGGGGGSGVATTYQHHLQANNQRQNHLHRRRAHRRTGALERRQQLGRDSQAPGLKARNAQMMIAIPSGGQRLARAKPVAACAQRRAHGAAHRPAARAFRSLQLAGAAGAPTTVSVGATLARPQGPAERRAPASDEQRAKEVAAKEKEEEEEEAERGNK